MQATAPWPWHTTIQPFSRTHFIIHRSVHLFHYTHCSTGPMEAARSFINMPFMNGVRSMLIDLRLTTSYQSPAMKMAHKLHCKPYSYHIKKCTFGISDILTWKRSDYLSTATPTHTKLTIFHEFFSPLKGNFYSFLVNKNKLN